VSRRGHLFLLGVSHHTAPVDLRERLDFSSRDVGDAVRTLAGRGTAAEAVLLSTCNRSEVYVVTDQPDRAQAEIVDFLATYHGLPAATFVPHLVERTDLDVVRHLFRVAAGLDSRIVGEPQILGQVKDAFQAAAGRQAVGPLLTRLFQHAFAVGKRVRSETALGEGAVSMGYAAVELARRTFGRLQGRNVLVIGAGEISTLAAQHLRSQGAGNIAVANRTASGAETLAQAVGGNTVAWHDLSGAIAGADIVVSATGAPRPVLTRDLVEAATNGRAARPLFIIDLAVPRDVEPSVGALRDVFVYNVDDLQALMHENTSKRGAEILHAEGIVGDEVVRFGAWRRSMGAVPAVVALRRRFDAIRRTELDRLGVKLSSLTEADRARVEDVTRLIIEKLLLEPTERLKAATDEETQMAYAEALVHLFRAGGGHARRGRQGESRPRPMRTLRLGTRGSALARVQADTVAAAVVATGRQVEIVVIRTSGDDKRDDAPFEGKGLFVKELETALLEGTIDIAVHSSKDMPAALAEGLSVAAVLPRAEPRDALVLGTEPEAGLSAEEALARLGAFPAIATSSPRRVAQLARLLPGGALRLDSRKRGSPAAAAGCRRGEGAGPGGRRASTGWASATASPPSFRRRSACRPQARASSPSRPVRRIGRRSTRSRGPERRDNDGMPSGRAGSSISIGGRMPDAGRAFATTPRAR
jgi:glutamyl-tRNA reductase